MKKKIIFGFSVFLCLLAGCTQKKYEPVKDAQNLEGRKVGVALAWAPDYLLTGRDDMELVRYNGVADMITAMCYHRLDMIAVEKPYVGQLFSCIEGVRMIEEPAGTTEIDCHFPISRTDLLEEFNAFLKDFKQTQEYEDLLNRFQADGVYEPKQVEKKAGTTTLRTGVSAENYPFSYLNFETGEYEGCEIELLQHFANACGYELELHAGTYNSNTMAIINNTLDLAISGYSELYREDEELSGYILVSDSYLPSDIVFLELDPSKKVKMLSTIDY